MGYLARDIPARYLSVLLTELPNISSAKVVEALLSCNSSPTDANRCYTEYSVHCALPAYVDMLDNPVLDRLLTAQLASINVLEWRLNCSAQSLASSNAPLLANYPEIPDS